MTKPVRRPSIFFEGSPLSRPRMIHGRSVTVAKTGIIPLRMVMQTLAIEAAKRLATNAARKTRWSARPSLKSSAGMIPLCRLPAMLYDSPCQRDNDTVRQYFSDGVATGRTKCNQ